ncbi:MAG: U32 family peptidase [Devosia sp.]|jgi:putative protease|uniref:ubiquinone anaerobic biosynthesis protein UbiU n=1 Tax=Devosia sp. 66-22 TaxID=1895753 RepID=UPI00092A1CC3|nr:peptidase U32 family protein [Devosia sp. 66-22]MBN9348632.1 U32 family peptidase [Devosia sp.]OJX47735.1 MAG: protease [Devosia sp. 66-22]
MELICPAGTPASFRDAVEAGADAVYCGFRDETNARNFPGLNFNAQELTEAATHARANGVSTLVAINTYMRAGAEELWYRAVDNAATAGADAIIVADLGLLAYAAERHPALRRHLSVQAAAANVEHINFLVDAFGIKRVVLPRVLTVAEVGAICRKARCETEVFVFGGLCVMEEGRCSLSSYATGKSPNMDGVCSPASHVRYRQDGSDMVSELGDFTINRFPKDEPTGYPTLCKGRFVAGGTAGYVFEDPASLDVLTHLEALARFGVSALKIEGRQRGRAYIAQVVREIRNRLDGLAAGEQREDGATLRKLSEGQRTTQGSYDKRWR